MTEPRCDVCRDRKTVTVCYSAPNSEDPEPDYVEEPCPKCTWDNLRVGGESGGEKP